MDPHSQSAARRRSGRSEGHLVLLHGLGQGPDAWDDLRAVAPPGWILHAPRLVGTDPTTPEAYFTWAAASAQLTELVGSLAGPVRVLGLSLGAMVALHAAGSGALAAERLVLCAPQVRPSRVLMGIQQRVLARMPEERFVDAPITRDQFFAALEAVQGADLREAAKAVRIPTVVVCGSRDVVNTPAARATRRLVPEASFLRVPGGHELNRQQPRALAELACRD
ncbi:Esterase/lipase [Kytococcus aerolatus]|uniref:Esterase/lipase n=1 Tax=Kytococcus aerolatus TaxID=592308 RepID=A0A212THC6_9MICO|nr:alpha/beta hydrolase [Kytococcus aerolatus]SNC65393.1 Esterase/lipase [Kytococcus aerolatus]